MADETAIIVSTGRTGTVALSRILGSYHPTVEAVHEPSLSRMLRLAGNMYVAGYLSDHHAARLLHLTVGRRARRTHAPWYIEASPLLRTLLVPLIRDVLPGSRVVHIVRDPREYVRSYINHGIFRGAKGLAAGTVPFAILKPEHLDPQTPARWRHMSRVDAIAWRWYALNRMIEDAAEQLDLGSSYLRLRFEDIFGTRRTGGLAFLCDWLGLNPEKLPADALDQPANASGGRDMAAQCDWPAEWHAAVERMCGSLMNEYGYR